MSVQAVVVWVQVRYLPREVAVAVVVIEEIGASGSVQKKKKKHRWFKRQRSKTSGEMSK